MIFTVNLMLLAAIGLLAVACIALAWGAEYRFQANTVEVRTPVVSRPMLHWTLKGLLAPFLIWAAINFPWPGGFEPLMPHVQYARSSSPKDWISTYLVVCLCGIFPIASYWSALTVGWVLMSQVRPADPEARAEFRRLCLFSLLFTSMPALLVLLVGGWTALGVAVGVLLLPLVVWSPSMVRRKKLPPMYARAIARIKFGKYAEAEQEIIAELEKHENDFDGWLMLAELYAVQFKDLPEAERSVLDLCEQPEVTPSQIAVALHKLADWHLNLAGDPVAARSALNLICEYLPRTHLAHMAQLRINSLPRTAEELQEQRASRPVPLPAWGDALDEATPPPPPIPREEAAAQANQLTARLRENPDDIAGRERLARLFAESLGKPELGIEQLWLLMGSAMAPEGKRPDWLGTIAAWELRLRNDRKTARKLLERMVSEFPRSPQAFAARRRLELMEREDRRWAREKPAG